MESEFAVQAILKKCVNKIINIETIDCYIAAYTFLNIYIIAAASINRYFLLVFSKRLNIRSMIG